MEQFGEAVPGRTAKDRPGAYGVALSKGLLLVVELRQNLYLPGGGVEAGELPNEALRREVLEETGHGVVRAVPLAKAGQYVMAADGYFNKICAFFSMDVGSKVSNEYSRGHAADWIPLDDAIPAMAEEASVWAVKKHLDLHGD